MLLLKPTSHVCRRPRIVLSLGDGKSLSRSPMERCFSKRCFASSSIRKKSSGPSKSSTQSDSQQKELPYHKKLLKAWTDTPTKWYPLPIFVGALLLAAINVRKQLAQRPEQEHVVVLEDGKEVIKLKGPFHVHVIGALPLRNLSRLWGYLNSLELPVWFRPVGFRIYAFIFGCNLSEIEPEDLTTYKSLGEFFYRRLKDGARVIAKDAPLVSPADGKVLHFGNVQGSRVEQVKGMTYSLDALLGSHESSSQDIKTVVFANRDHGVVQDTEFANVNGIEYSLQQLLGAPPTSEPSTPTEGSRLSSPFGTSGNSAIPQKHGPQTDASIAPSPEELRTHSREASVERTVGPKSSSRPASRPVVQPGNQLFFAVIYLAPGDYHRFHSPAPWVVERRRHFVGELFSVSPYMARRLPNLFVLNERVALLGRWKYGFFSMTPVGATNVGSILLNFDRELRTNERGRVPLPGSFTEAVYTQASEVLGGQPLRAGEEMGGFCLGSTVVLVFEAPDNFAFTVKAGEKVKVGQKLGDVLQIDKTA